MAPLLNVPLPHSHLWFCLTTSIRQRLRANSAGPGHTLLFTWDRRDITSCAQGNHSTGPNEGAKGERVEGGRRGGEGWTQRQDNDQMIRWSDSDYLQIGVYKPLKFVHSSVVDVPVQRYTTPFFIILSFHCCVCVCVCVCV